MRKFNIVKVLYKLKISPLNFTSKRTVTQSSLKLIKMEKFAL